MSEKIDQAYIEKLGKQLMLGLSDDEQKDVLNEFSVLSQQLALLDKIDVNGVEPMIYPFEEETEFLREDEVTNVISQESALSNVARVRKEFVVLPRVVK